MGFGGEASAPCEQGGVLTEKRDGPRVPRRVGCALAFSGDVGSQALSSPGPFSAPPPLPYPARRYGSCPAVSVQPSPSYQAPCPCPGLGPGKQPRTHASKHLPHHIPRTQSWEAQAPAACPWEDEGTGTSLRPYGALSTLCPVNKVIMSRLEHGQARGLWSPGLLP